MIFFKSLWDFKIIILYGVCMIVLSDGFVLQNVFLIVIVLKINLNSRNRYTRSRISSSPLEGRMHGLWRLRRIRMWSSSRFVARSTCTHYVCLMLRRLKSWSNLFPQVSCLVGCFFLFVLIYSCYAFRVCQWFIACIVC